MKRERKSPQVYSVSEIGEILSIGRSTAYRYVEEVYEEKGPFPVLKIRNQYRIPRRPFDAWLGENLE